MVDRRVLIANAALCVVVPIESIVTVNEKYNYYSNSINVEDLPSPKID